MAAEKPLNWKLNLFVIWLTQTLSISGFSLIIPFIPLYIRDTWGVTDEGVLGAWMAAFTFFGMLSYCVFTPLWGFWADRYGRKLMLLRAFYVDGILFPCLLLAPNPFWLIVFRFIVSAFTGTVAAAQTLIVTTTPQKHHTFALGVISSAIWSGCLLGYAAGGLIINYLGYTTAFLFCGGMYIVSGILAHMFVRDDFRRVPTDSSDSSDSSDKRRKFLDGVTPVIGMIFLLIVLFAVARRFDDPYVSLMVEKVHGPQNTALYAGWVSAIAAVAGTLSALWIGRLGDRLSPGIIIYPTLLIAAGTMFLQAIATNLPFFTGARFVNFLVAGGMEPIFFSLLSKNSPESRRGAIFGIASGLRMAGILISSLASGGLIYFLGIRQIYAAGGLLFLMILPFYLVTARVARRMKAE